MGPSQIFVVGAIIECVLQKFRNQYLNAGKAAGIALMSVTLFWVDIGFYGNLIVIARKTPKHCLKSYKKLYPFPSVPAYPCNTFELVQFHHCCVNFTSTQIYFRGNSIYPSTPWERFHVIHFTHFSKIFTGRKSIHRNTIKSARNQLNGFNHSSRIPLKSKHDSSKLISISLPLLRAKTLQNIFV